MAFYPADTPAAIEQMKTTGESMLSRLFNRAPSVVLETVQARAERGDADAQFNLGLEFAQGQGKSVDYEQALRWFFKAAEQGHVRAQFNLGIMYARGQGMPSDQSQSVLWMQKAANLGDAEAQYSLGIAHYRASLARLPKATNAAESRVEAYKWLQLAAAQRYQDSERVWTVMTLEMTNEDVADGNRRVAAFLAAQPKLTQDAPIRS